MRARVDAPAKVPSRSARGKRMVRMRRMKLERNAAMVLRGLLDWQGVAKKLKAEQGDEDG